MGMEIFQSYASPHLNRVRIPEGTVKILYEIESAKILKDVYGRDDVLNMKLREIEDNSYGVEFRMVGTKLINRFMDKVGIEKVVGENGARTKRLVGKKVFALIAPLEIYPKGLLTD